jgi:hypothetical protein
MAKELLPAIDGCVSAAYAYGPFGEVIRASGPMAKLNPARAEPVSVLTICTFSWATAGWDGSFILDWTRDELTRRGKGDKHKVALARRLRAETTMSLAWIAEHLRMGSWSYISDLLRKTKSANSED